MQLHRVGQPASCQERPALAALTDMQRFVLSMSGLADGRGSDVRLTSGELTSPSRIKRVSMDARAFVWKELAAWDMEPI